MLNRLLRASTLLLALAATGPVLALAAPDALVRQIAVEVLDTAKAVKAIQAGDVSRIIALVDTKVMPHVNFEIMTRAAVGPQWRTATPEQRESAQ